MSAIKSVSITRSTIAEPPIFMTSLKEVFNPTAAIAVNNAHLETWVDISIMLAGKVPKEFRHTRIMNAIMKPGIMGGFPPSI